MKTPKAAVAKCLTGKWKKIIMKDGVFKEQEKIGSFDEKLQKNSKRNACCFLLLYRECFACCHYLI